MSHANNAFNMGSFIEDPFQAMQAMPQSHPSQVQQPETANYAQGLQMPQPLKQSTHITVPVQSSSNTVSGFDYYNGSNYAQSLGFQKNAIRGKIASTSAYDWNAALQSSSNGQGGNQQQMQPVVPSFQFMSDPKQMLRQAICDIYRNPNMLKTNVSGPYSVFKAPVEGLTGGSYKYIVAVVPYQDHIPVGGQASLVGLPWVSFQTRQTDQPALEFGEVRPKPTPYSIPSDQKSPVFDIINMVLDDQTKFIYMAETLPIKVELIKLRASDVAAQKAMLMSAMEAFKTVITFTQ
jgi:hypothetical protein